MNEPQIQSGASIRRLLFSMCGAGGLLLAMVLAGKMGMATGWLPFGKRQVTPTPRSPQAAAVTDRSAVQDLSPGDSLPEGPGPSPPKTIGARIAAGVASRQQHSAAENLGELDAMARKLETMSSNTSVDELAGHLQGLMGLDARVAQPTASVPVTQFDIDTAQLHDVQRQEPAPGEFRYKAVLIDAQGQTLDIELTAAEGSEIYRIMERIKASPLLERVYQRIAMPLLDSLVQAARDKAKGNIPQP